MAFNLRILYVVPHKCLYYFLTVNIYRKQIVVQLKPIYRIRPISQTLRRLSSVESEKRSGRGVLMSLRCISVQ